MKPGYSLALMLLIVTSSASAAGKRCDSVKAMTRMTDVVTVGTDDSAQIPLRLASVYCQSKDPKGRSGNRMGLETADGKTLVPQRYNQIIVLNNQWSLVQKDDLGSTPNEDDGWYLYEHNEGEGKKLPWDKFSVTTPRSMKALPGVVIAVGEIRSEAKFGQHHIGVMTSFMKKVQDFPGLYGYAMEGTIDYFDILRGQRRSVQLYRNNAFVVHTQDGSQMFNLQGEAITPILADIQLLQNGRDAVSPLMKARHRDLPKNDGGNPIIPGQTADTVYLPLDNDGSLLPLPDGAVGVMWIPSLNSERDIYISGWGLVFPRGKDMEIAIGSGAVVDVVKQAARLPRYSGMSLGNDKSTAYRLMLKLPESSEWLSVNSSNLQVDERSQRAAHATTLWRQTDKEVLDKYMADRQKTIDRNAEILRLREEENRRRTEASDRYHAQVDALRERARAGNCDYEVRNALYQFDAQTQREVLTRCGLSSKEDISLASHVGVSPQKISEARADFDRRNGALEAQRARNAGTAALLNAMKYRGPDSNWAEVRIYDRNGMYQATRTMTGTQAEVIGAKP